MGKKIILSVMILLLLVPTAAMVTGKGKRFEIGENRVKKELPVLTAGMEGKELSSGIEAWYNDNFGLRDLLIRMQHQLDYSLFRYNPTLFFGEDGYMVYRSIAASEQLANETSMDEAGLKSVVDSSLKVKNFLEEKGIAYRLVLPPQKNEVLPEEMEHLPVKRPEPIAYERLESAIEASALKENYVWTLETLMEANEKMPVFYRTDFHWNSWGAVVGMGKVMNSYAESLGIEPLVLPEALEAREFYYEGGQLDNLSILKDKGEMAPIVGYFEERPVDFLDNDGSGLICWESRNPVLEGSVLFIGDSYTMPIVYGTNGISCGVPEIFERTYFCHWDDSWEVMKRLPEDVKLVVTEKIESNIYLLNKLTLGLLGEEPK